jgi:hypothetical protein
MPIATANQVFLQSLPKPADGENEHLASFLAVTERVMDILPSFSIHDVLSQSLAYELPLPEVKRLFEAWSEKMVDMCKLEKIQGCYNYPVFVRI